MILWAGEVATKENQTSSSAVPVHPPKLGVALEVEIPVAIELQRVVGLAVKILAPLHSSLDGPGFVFDPTAQIPMDPDVASK